MGRKFNPSILFEPWKRQGMPVPYPTDKSMLDDVRSRKKAMLRTGCPLSYIAAGGEGFIDLLDAAFDRDLIVVLHNRDIKFKKGSRMEGYREPNIFVTHIDQVWRISAIDILRETAFVENGRWSPAAEAQESMLLGYSKKQRTEWLAWQANRQAAWTSRTVYALLTNPQKRGVLDLGGRCFGSVESLRELNLFFHTRHELKQRAYRLVPAGLTLARAGLTWRATEAVFGDFKTWKKRGLIGVKPTSAQARRINAGLTSNVQLLTPRGWS